MEVSQKPGRETLRRKRSSWRAAGIERGVWLEKNAVILNGVSLRAKAGAKRSEGSLTETRAEAVW